MQDALTRTLTQIRQTYNLVYCIMVKHLQQVVRGLYFSGVEYTICCLARLPLLLNFMPR